MTRASARQQAVEEATSARTESGSQASGPGANENFPISNPIANPLERTPTTLNRRTFSQLCFQFGIHEADARLSKEGQFADIAPFGFVTINRQMCSHGAILLFNPFLGTFFRRLSIAPSLLHPNGYAILLGLCVLFLRTLNCLSTFDEVCFLCTISKGKDHPSILNVKSARNRRLILNLSDSAHGFLNQYFYVSRPAGFYCIWRDGGDITYHHLTHFESL